ELAGGAVGGLEHPDEQAEETVAHVVGALQLLGGVVCCCGGSLEVMFVVEEDCSKDKAGRRVCERGKICDGFTRFTSRCLSVSRQVSLSQRLLVETRCCSAVVS
ncbi:unnamed protein product, partial [Ectocarpus sp. 8 AP-2014]